MTTRHLVENGLPMCRECHNRFDKDKNFRDLIIKNVITIHVMIILEKIKDGVIKSQDIGYEEIK